MKPGTILAHASGGGVIDQNPLLHGLQIWKTAGAVPDVFETKPLPFSSSLQRAENPIISPHRSSLPEG